MIGIYKIVNKVNDKVYVGSAVNVKRRWNEHRICLKKNDHDNQYLQNAWNKYGEDNFLFEVIEEVQDKQLLLEREQYWLDYCNSSEDNKGYNICKIAGSSLGTKRSEEQIKKMSGENNPMFGKHLSEEHKQKISESHKGEKNHFYGKHHNEETKRKLSESKIGKYKGEKNPNYGKYRISSEETRRKISAATKGENNPKVKLIWSQVREIREKYIPREYGYEKLAREYNVSTSCIQYILNNRSWKEEEINNNGN